MNDQQDGGEAENVKSRQTLPENITATGPAMPPITKGTRTTAPNIEPIFAAIPLLTKIPSPRSSRPR